ncbi:MAG TPA: SapC family protein [Burkholderiales bacterium]|nr:SapC family protein [Burkholderiales bacterium]
MAKQLLIYDSVVPLSSARHATASIETTHSYAFSAGVNAVPLMAVEFLRAAAEYAIVFTPAGDEIMPAVVLGIRNDQNLYLTADAQWQAKYVPAFIRRYPFVFSTSADSATLTLCIDESYPGLNNEGRGERLFTDERKPSPYADQVLKFLQEYQASFQRTRAFGKRVKEAGLLEPMEAQVTTPKGEKFSLGGFMAVSRQKLRALSGDTLASLAKTDELELLYLHLYSMRNFNEVKERLVTAASRAPEEAAAAIG